MILTGYMIRASPCYSETFFCHWEEVLWDSERVIEEHSLLKIDFGPNSTLPAKEGRNIEPLLDNEQVKIPWCMILTGYMIRASPYYSQTFLSLGGSSVGLGASYRGAFAPKN